MAYQPNIPLATDQLSQSQSDLQGNFQAIKALVDVNHVDFTDGVDMGKHKWINFPVQTGLPGSSFAAGEVGLYNQLPTANPLTTVNELWINKQTTGGAVQIPLTASVLSYNPSPSSLSSGWSYLPSGILLKWGQSTDPAQLVGNSNASRGNVPFPVNANIPVFNQVFQVMVVQTWSTNRTSVGSNGFSVYSVNTTGFIVTWSGSNSSGTGISYLAIGY
jgi:hypothetical protein